MTDYDLVVLIPWFIFSVALILICIRLQRSSRRSRHSQAQPGQQVQGSGAEPADDPDATSPSGRDSRRGKDTDQPGGAGYLNSRPLTPHRALGPGQLSRSMPSR